MLKKIKRGIIGMDRSGSRGDFPFVVTSVYSDKVGNFEKTIREVKSELKIKLGYIKGKDFKPNQYRKVIEILKKNGISFFVHVIPRKVYDHIEKRIKWRKAWESILEAHFWFKVTNNLINKIKILPSEIFYESTYFGSEEFDKTIKELFSSLNINKNDVLIGDKTSSYIMVADWVSHFFYKNKELRKIYKKDVKYCRLEDIKELIKNEPSSRVVHGPTANPRMTQAINIVKLTIFKPFDCLANKPIVDVRKC